MSRHAPLIARRRLLSCALVATLVSAACGATARLPVTAGTGPNPVLPAPEKAPIPLVKVATAKGWSDEGHPVAAEGTVVTAFARGLDHPRWLHVLPNGDVLVAEANAPVRPEDGKGLKGWFFKRYQKKAGGAVPSANRITLLRDADGDGVAEQRSVFVSGLYSPFGMALVGDVLYIANSDALVRVPYTAGEVTTAAAPVKVVALPGGPLNHHWTKNVIASRDGKTLYVAVGSNSNVAENGIEQEEGRAAIWEIDPATGSHRIFVPFTDGRPSGEPLDVLNGFLDEQNDAMGARSALLSTRTGRCWWPTTWATQCGACAAQRRAARAQTTKRTKKAKDTKDTWALKTQECLRDLRSLRDLRG
jgi:glucose/arabinose dehydrogenase